MQFSPIKNLGLLPIISSAVAFSLTSTNVFASDEGIEETVIISSGIEQPLRQIATSISVLTFDNLNLKNYHSLADALRTEPGIAVSNAGGYNKQSTLRIRGEEGFRTVMFIDGIKISDPTAVQSTAQIEHFGSTADISQVEILRGPQGFIYGADAGGVVSITTKRGSENLAANFSANIDKKNTNNVQAHVSNAINNVDYSVALSQFETEGFNARLSDDVLKDNDGSKSQTAHVKIGYQLTDKLDALLVHRQVKSTSEFDNCFGANLSTSNNCEALYDQDSSRALLSYQSKKVNHALSYSKSDIGRDSLTDGETGFSAKGKRTEIEYTGRFKLSSKHSIHYGADVETSKNLSSTDSLERKNYGLFAEFQNEILTNLFITIGNRYDHNSHFGTHNSWRLSSAYTVPVFADSEIKLRGTVGNGYRAPSLFEQNYNDDPSSFGSAKGFQLKEELSQGFDLGIDLFSNGAKYALTYFDQEIENEIRFDNSGFSGYLQSDGTSSSKGVEIEALYPLSSFLSIDINATYNKTASSTGEQRLRRPKLLANIGAVVTLDDDRFKTLINLRRSQGSKDETFFASGTLVELDDYQVLDLSSVFKANKHFNLTLKVDNLLDEEYEEVRGFNTLGRTVSVGFVYQI